MQDFSNQIYKFGGKLYIFSAYLFNDVGLRASGNFLNNEDILLFQYENSLNSLYLKGELVVVDNYGIIDKYLELQYVYCTIYHAEQELKRDGTLTITTDSKVHRFLHDFFVTGIEVLERKNTLITYKINLISSNWLNCMGIIKYTNYSAPEPTEIFLIIKTMLLLNHLLVNNDTFDNITSPVKLRYITHENDNTITSIRYLLNKLYYYLTQDTSMKFLVYNESLYVYQVFDVANQNYINGSTMIILSLFKSNTETMVASEPINIATITKVPKTYTFLHGFTREIFNYNYNHNHFMNNDILAKSIALYKNEKPSTSENYLPKYNYTLSDLIYKLSSSFWNNDINIYDECAKILNEDNALVVAVDAAILRKPGAYVNLNIDRNDTSFASSEDPGKLNDTKNKYIGFEGLWIIGKTRHIISPQSGRYKLNLVLFRNFLVQNR